MNINKLDMMSSDLTGKNKEIIEYFFPNCMTEVRAKDGSIHQAIDFDLLKQELSDFLVEGSTERYQLDWPGKRESLLASNAPIAKTLRPSREESVKFDDTENLFIEGDNLEALKLLQESYLGKVKMIYIDPPYNTGNDFVYNDDFAEDADEYLGRSLQKDEAGNRLVANPESKGRYHSDWLSMMYSRLRLARNLLTDDGVIFISIDDNEQANLKRLCDEVFGEQNFIANFIWEKRTNRENRKVVSSRHDYLLCYIHSKTLNRAINQLPMNAKALANYKNLDNDPRGDWKSDPATAQAGHGTKDQFYDLLAPNGNVHKLQSGRCWLYTEQVMQKAISENRIWFGKHGNGVPRIKTYLNDKERGLTPETILFAEEVGTNETSKNFLKKMFSNIAVFETPKPIDLLIRTIMLATNFKEDNIILDFFAGSSTTAHAVMQLNAEDGGNRKFIMVQLPEETDEKSEAFKAGYKTIAEISKERIRRAGKQILESTEIHADWNQDIGFRVLKVAESNMKDVYYKPQELTQSDLLEQIDNVKEDVTPEDLLFQVMLDWGLPLSLPVHTEVIEGKTVYFVAGDALIACFDAGITESLVKALAEREPLRILFRDNYYDSNDVKINAEQLVKQLSPNTELRSI